MHYVEIGQDIIDAIKGGAYYNGESETEEIVGTISDFSANFAEIIKIIKSFVEEFLEAIKKYF